jgi:hypothetical protein
MVKTLKALFLALTLMSAGFVVGKLDGLDWPASAQQAAPSGSAPVAPGARDGAAPQPGAALRSAARESAANLAPEVKIILEQVAKRVEAMETLLTGLVEEARAKAIGYAVWMAVGLFALMFVSSVLGGTVVALMLKRSRST